jgi:uncharacterized protein with ParB-like and HNH nuclease domain
MPDAETDDVLHIEEENDEPTYVEFDLSVSPSDPTLELLSNQIERGDIIIPFYQRRYVWKIEQASRLIESFLMGLPVPQIFLYVNEEDRLEVIDGQQRMMSVHYFLKGLFGDEDVRGKKQVFKLKGLSERSEFNGKLFIDLSPRDQRRLKNATLRAINIKQLKPSIRNDSVFHIFERLNTGGTQLKPQEIRNAVYRGEIVDNLRHLNKLASWQSILGLKGPDRNQKDVELVLRLFSLYKNWKNYEKPMLKFLNRFMDQNRKYNNEVAREFSERFPQVADLVSRSLVNPFRPRGVINSAVLEAVMVALLENPNVADRVLKEKYPELLKDKEFLSRTTGGTTDTMMVQSRIRVAKQVFADG